MIKRHARRYKHSISHRSRTRSSESLPRCDTSVNFENPEDVERIHDLQIKARGSVPELRIFDVVGHARQQPYNECRFTPATVGLLVGLSLTRGYRRDVLATLGRPASCSHFLTLALDLSAANVLSIYLRMRDKVENTPENRRGRGLGTSRFGSRAKPTDACLTLCEDSPVQRHVLDDWLRSVCGPCRSRHTWPTVVGRRS